MRPMVIEFDDDPACDYLDRQYMLGERILVAPIFSEDKSVKYYVPEGVWTNLLNNEKIQGGKWREETHDYFSLPVLVRPNSLIAIGNNEKRADYDFAENVTFHLFELQDGHSAGAVVYNQQGIVDLELKVIRQDNSLFITSKGKDKPWRLLLRNIHDIQKADDFGVFSSESGVVIEPEKNIGEFSITIA